MSNILSKQENANDEGICSSNLTVMKYWCKDSPQRSQEKYSSCLNSYQQIYAMLSTQQWGILILKVIEDCIKDRYRYPRYRIALN